MKDETCMGARSNELQCVFIRTTDGRDLLFIGDRISLLEKKRASHSG